MKKFMLVWCAVCAMLNLIAIIIGLFESDWHTVWLNFGLLLLNSACFVYWLHELWKEEKQRVAIQQESLQARDSRSNQG
ncbi:Uncharacterised protein [uncultured archaeon]|nr:Uncharacterised protein [uncultured archaeon]